MSLQLRRGTNAERLTMTPAVGEIIYTTDTKKVWAGDGATVGGIEVGSTAPVDSVAGKTGVVTLVKADITDADWASAAQGTLADSATQPLDNISTLTNDSGFTNDQTGAEIKVAYEGELNTNAFSDANVTTLSTALQAITGESIKDLSDVFSSMTPTDGQVLTYDTTNGWQAETQAAIPSAFTDLTDTPANYTGESLKVVRVNAGETALEYVAAGTPTLPTTTKGDMIAFSTVDARLPVGTNDQVLTADSTQALGVKWADAAGGGGNWLTANNGSDFTTAPGATGTNSICLGDGSTANHTDAIIIGRGSDSNVDRDIIIGSNTTHLAGSGSEDSGILIGHNIISTASRNIGIGNGVWVGGTANSAGDDAHIAIGDFARSGGAGTDQSIALGRSARALGTNVVAIGAWTGMFYGGSYNNSVYIGDDLRAVSSNEVMLGSNGSGYIHYTSNDSLKLTGSNSQFVIPPYTTAARPTGMETGSHVFDTTLGKPIWYNGTNWVDATGTTV